MDTKGNQSHRNYLRDHIIQGKDIKVLKKIGSIENRKRNGYKEEYYIYCTCGIFLLLLFVLYVISIMRKSFLVKVNRIQSFEVGWGRG